MRTGKAFEVSVDGALLSFKILKMFELDGQSGLERAVKDLSKGSEPLAVLFGPGGLALGEDVSVVAQDP